MTKTIARIASAAAIALAAIPVVAAGSAHAETLMRRVAVSDLDFARADHVARFEHRISRVAAEICPADSRQNSAKAEACRSDLRRQAVARLGQNQRTQLAMTQSNAYSLAAK